MKEINRIFDKMVQELKDPLKSKKAESEVQEANWFKDIIVDLVNLEGLEIEICGWFIWVDGNTKEHRKTLKEKGFYWSSNKQKWYHKPSWYKGNKGRKWSIEEIRNTYGSQKVKEEKEKRYAKHLAGIRT